MSIESNIEIPTEVPVMTLRDVVLFPQGDDALENI